MQSFSRSQLRTQFAMSSAQLMLSIVHLQSIYNSFPHMADSMGQFRLGTAIIKRLVGAPKATTPTKLEREKIGVSKEMRQVWRMQ